MMTASVSLPRRNVTTAVPSSIHGRGPQKRLARRRQAGMGRSGSALGPEEARRRPASAELSPATSPVVAMS